MLETTAENFSKSSPSFQCSIRTLKTGTTFIGIFIIHTCTSLAIIMINCNFQHISPVNLLTKRDIIVHTRDNG